MGWFWHSHQWDSWEIVRQEGEILIQKRRCYLCGYTQINQTKLPCEYTAWQEIRRGKDVVHGYLIIYAQRTCKHCGNIQLKTYS